MFFLFYYKIKTNNNLFYCSSYSIYLFTTLPVIFKTTVPLEALLSTVMDLLIVPTFLDQGTFDARKISKDKSKV